MMYNFHDFKDLAKGDGFGYPVDVKYGTVYIGTLIAEPDGYVIRQIDTPTGKISIKQNSKNKFKTKDEAANILHNVWKMERQGKENYTENVMKKSQLKKLIKEIFKMVSESQPNDKELFHLFKTIDPKSGLYDDTPFGDNLRNFAYIIITKHHKTPEDAEYVINQYWRQSPDQAKRMVKDVTDYIKKKGSEYSHSPEMRVRSDEPQSVSENEDDDFERRQYDRQIGAYNKRNKTRYECPTCKTPDALSAWQHSKGYQCDRCADSEEGTGYQFESTEPSIGGSYNDQQTSFNSYVKPERDALTDPRLTGKEPFKK